MSSPLTPCTEKISGHGQKCIMIMFVREKECDDSSQSQSSTRDLGDFTGVEGQSGKIMCQGGKPDTGHIGHLMYIRMNVCGSAYENGCVVDGMYATAAD